MRGLLQKSVEKAAEIIRSHRYARVISHYDADGITSAGIICNALIRSDIQFHTTIVGKLERSFIQGLGEDLVIICDMGTAQSDLVSECLKKKDVVIIDHHSPSLSVQVPVSPSRAPPAIINPFCLGADEKRMMTNERGSTISAAGLSYLVARCISGEAKGNIDLAGLAIAGTLGDKLEFDTGINRMILDEAVKEGVVSVKKGLKLGDGKIRDLILFATDPYIPLAGKGEWVDAFLNKEGIDGERILSDLNEEEERRLTSALLALLRESRAEIGDEDLVGTTYNLRSEVIRDGVNFMRTVDACGRLGKSGIGIGLCLREERLVEEATSLYLNFQNRLVSELSRIESEESVKELQNIAYFFVQESGVTGVLAGVVAKYICTSKPVIVFNRKEGIEGGKRGETKISARCNKRLISVSGGIDLAKALERASGVVGGFGGGHPGAAGATIPEGSEEKFITALDTIIGEQKKKDKPGLTPQSFSK
ncbi:MAG: DHHA1 domain-containing protein [Candidatus Methanospirareceae archaeon]